MINATLQTTLETFQPLEDIDPHPQSLSAFFQAALKANLPVVLWRYPYQKAKEAMVDLSGQVQPNKINFEHPAPGFAFSPFVDDAGQLTLFVKADLIFRDGLLSLHKGDQALANDQTARNRDRFLGSYRALIAQETLPPLDWDSVPVTAQRSKLANHTEFCNLVEQAVNYIQSTDIKKVVASRATEVPLPAAFNPVDAFENLCSRYAHAFVSLVSIPGIGTWVGASPETLLSIEPGVLRTVALAGTQARQADMPLSAVTWGDKEIEEQALVSDYIREFFQQLNLASFEEQGPRTVSAGNVVHLRTDFSIQDEQSNLTQLGNRILNDLHPTSAVCGMPRREALTFILDEEGYDREFYSGFLGPIHINGQSRLFVNLRCMQFTADSAILYVGAGITQDSVPELEWQETIWKSKTLLPILTGDDVG